MTAGAGTRQSTRTHRPGRIIERPRLIKQLDAAEAPVILIVAPAGYGKTTLARQWAKTLSGVIWVSCTPSHRDVVTFSEDVAAGIDALGGNASRFIGEYMRARSNPQRAAREIAQVLAEKLNDSPAQWLIVDDYQELMETPALEEIVALLGSRCRLRMLIASRVRPSWLAARQLIYDEVSEVGTAELALTESEVVELIGSRPDLAPVMQQARGWPAVVALASRLPGMRREEPVSTTLHQYVAEELFVGAEPSLQRGLMDFALLPSLTPDHLHAHFGSDASEILTAARDVGFVSPGEPPELHPLLREFLLTKLAEAKDIDRVRRAVTRALDADAWAAALELVVRFGLGDLVDEVLQHAFKPLVRGGRLSTLRAFAGAVESSDGFACPAIDVVQAEVALREGHFELAAAIAERAHTRLPITHELKCRASLISGRAHFFSASFEKSARAYESATREALDDGDKLEGAFGLAATTLFSEEGDPSPALAELERLKHVSPTALVRYATVRLNLGRFVGVSASPPLEEAVAALPLAPDPHVRTAFTYTSAYLLCVRGEYRRAAEFLAMFEKDIREFDLDFGRPFLDWTYAFVELGLRRFGEADRRLQRVEDAAAGDQHATHGFNARILRARLLLQTGEPDAAIELLREPSETPVYPSWRGELAATRALALACVGRVDESNDEASQAERSTKFVEVALLVHAARAVAAATDPHDDGTSAARLFAEAARTDAWDPVICALRSAKGFSTRVANDDMLRPAVRSLLQRSGDVVLARQLGLTARSTRMPASLLSPREMEVIGLMARGMRNKEIAAALFVAESTVKVHVRHILEKLGVRSRSAAVARYERAGRD